MDPWNHSITIFSVQFQLFLDASKTMQNVWPLIEVHQVLISLNMWLCISLQWRHNERDGVSNHRCLHCLFNCWFWWRLKKTSKIRVTGLCAGNSPVTGEFPAQKISNVEDVSIWWRHHGGDVAIYYKIWSMGDVAVIFYEYFGTLTRSWLVFWEFAVQLPSDKCESTWSINIRFGNGLVPVRDQCCHMVTHDVIWCHEILANLKIIYLNKIIITDITIEEWLMWLLIM